MTGLGEESGERNENLMAMMWRRIVVRRMFSAADVGKSFAGIFEISRWAETPEGLHEHITASRIPKVEENKTKEEYSVQQM